VESITRRHKLTDTRTSFYIKYRYVVDELLKKRRWMRPGWYVLDRISRLLGDFVSDGHDLALKPFDRLQTRDIASRPNDEGRRYNGTTTGLPPRYNDDGLSDVEHRVYLDGIKYNIGGTTGFKSTAETLPADNTPDHQQSSRTSVSFVVRCRHTQSAFVLYIQADTRVVRVPTMSVHITFYLRCTSCSRRDDGAREKSFRLPKSYFAPLVYY